MTFELDRWRLIPGMIEDDEGVALYQTAAQLPANARCLEIGSYMGKSSIAIMSGLRDGGGGRLTCVDPFAGTGLAPSVPSKEDQKRGSNALSNNILNWPLGTYWSGVAVMDSSRYFLTLAPYSEIDFVFIDGLHTRVDEDMLSAWRHLTPGGTMICHDYHVVDPDYFWITKLIDRASLPGKWMGGTTKLWKAVK